jgi:uncharacterized protein (DUF1810 family)
VTANPFDLQRFIDAQDGVYETALAELRAGSKQSHWMWFIFPQLAGLGSSPMARRYALHSLEEARAYLAHPLLGPRLAACVELLNAVEGRTIQAILGPPDDLKFRSCLTLFLRAGAPPCFRQALDKYYDGQEDPLTLDLL